jgi:hypothetical protein
MVLHDCNKILDGHAEELSSALQHKNTELSNVSLCMLDPATVLYLFSRMTDEVHTFLFIFQDYYMQRVPPVRDIGLFNVFSSSLLVLKNCYGRG